MNFGVLIIGLGQIGMGYDLHLDVSQYVYSHARAFSQHPQFHLLAGVDPDTEQCRIFTSNYGCNAYENLTEAFEKNKPDLVIISVPTQFHFQTLQQVLEEGSPRLILCEKPLSYDLEEARLMVEMCSKKNMELYVNYMRRSDPGVIEIKRRIEAGELGNPLKGVSWYSKGFLHNGSHYFNLMEYWLGSMKNSFVLNQGRSLGKTDSEPDVHVSFERGEVVFLSAWEEAFSHYTIELLSPRGRLRYERSGELIEWEEVESDSKKSFILSHEKEKIPSGMNRYQWHVAEQLAKALLGEEAQLSSGKEALQTLENMKKVLQ